MAVTSEPLDTIVESRLAVMVSNVGNCIPILRKAHFIKPSRNLSFSPADKAQLLKHHPLLYPSSAPLICDGRKNWPLQVTFKSWPKNPSNPKWKSWVQHLAPSHETLWRAAGIYEAILGSTHGFVQNRRLIMSMAERWCPETNTFVFPWGEATLTLEDAMILGGFSVSGAPFFACSCKEIEEVKGTLKQAAVVIRMGTNSAEEFRDVWISRFMFSGSEMMELEHHAFLSLWLDRYVLNDPQGRTMKSSVFAVAAHLARGKPVALAPPVLANIYGDLTLLKATIMSASKTELDNEEVMAVNLWSLLHFVQLWVWERVPKLHPEPNSIRIGDPRSAMWDGVKSRRVMAVRKALDTAGDTFMWRPYVISGNGWKCPEFYSEEEELLDITGWNDHNLLSSYGLCLRVSELVGQGCIELYLPHRVAMQFGMDQDFPDIVAPSNECREIVWLTYSRPPSGNAAIYVPPRLFEPDVTLEYLTWWREPFLFSSEGFLKDVSKLGTRTTGKRRRLASLYSLQQGNEANNDIIDLVIPSAHLDNDDDDDDDDDDDNVPIALARRRAFLRKKALLPSGETTEEADRACFDNDDPPAEETGITVSGEDMLISTPSAEQAPVTTSLCRTPSTEEGSMETQPVIPLIEHSRSKDNNIGGGASSSEEVKKIMHEVALLEEISRLQKELEEIKGKLSIKVQFFVPSTDF
ncbi:Protein MAINTENANCE OF MERISTEMS [Linum grandiflorum]